MTNKTQARVVIGKNTIDLIANALPRYAGETITYSMSGVIAGAEKVSTTLGEIQKWLNQPSFPWPALVLEAIANSGQAADEVAVDIVQLSINTTGILTVSISGFSSPQLLSGLVAEHPPLSVASLGVTVTYRTTPDEVSKIFQIVEEK